MRIASVLNEWFAANGWEERADPAESDIRSTAFTYLRNADQWWLACKFVCGEELESIQMFMYWSEGPPDPDDYVTCPASCWQEARELAAYFNDFAPFGCWQVDATRATIRFRHSIAVADAFLEPAHIENLIGVGIHATALALPRLAALYAGEVTAAEAIADLDEMLRENSRASEV